MNYRFSLRVLQGMLGWSEPELLKFPGDVYIEMQEYFVNEDYAMDMLAWAEEAHPGDVYKDDNIILIAL